MAKNDPFAGARKYAGKNGAQRLGPAAETHGVPILRPFIVPPNSHEFNDRWISTPKATKADHKLPVSPKKK